MSSMKSISTLAACLVTILLSGQSSSLTHIEAIPVQLDKNRVYYTHTMKQKETLYSLARFFHVSVEDLVLINKLPSAQSIPIGSPIQVPIDRNLIRTPAQKTEDAWIPLLYTVDRRETLFKIANTYFPQPIQHLIKRNNVTSFSIKSGRNLVIGWWGAPEDVSNSQAAQELPSQESTSKTPVTRQDPETAPIAKKKESLADLIRNKIITRADEPQDNTDFKKEDPNPRDNTIPQQEYSDNEALDRDTIISELTVIDTLKTTPEEPVINYQSGIAEWDKGGFDRENLFVMHNEAKPNSYMRLRHPVTKNEVTALVLCPIPKEVHGSDIDVYLSPAVATALGALNSRFKVEMDYHQ